MKWYSSIPIQPCGCRRLLFTWMLLLMFQTMSPAVADAQQSPQNTTGPYDDLPVINADNAADIEHKFQLGVGAHGGTSLGSDQTMSPDGTLLAVAKSHFVTVWDIQNHVVLQRITLADDVIAVTLTHDNDILIETADLVISLYQTVTGEEIWRLDTREAFPLSGISAGKILLSPDRQTLVTFEYAGSIDVKVIDVPTFELRHQVYRVWNTPSRPEISPDSRYLAIGYVYGASELINLQSGDVDQKLSRGGALNYSFSADTQYVAVGGRANVKVWDVATGTELKELPSGGWAAMSNDGTLVAIGKHNYPNIGTPIEIWDWANETLLLELGEHEGDVQHLRFSPDDQVLSTAGGDGIAAMWDVDDGELLHLIRGHVYEVQSLAIYPQGDRLASIAGIYSYQNCELIIWDLAQQDALHRRAIETPCLDLVVSPNGDMLALASSERNVYLFDATNLDELGLISMDVPNAPSITSIAFSPDGENITLTAYGNGVARWNFDTEAFLHMQDPSIRYNDVLFSSDGEHIAAAGWDSDITFWDASNGAQAFTLRAHASSVTGLGFSPVQNQLASTDGRTIRIWDLDTRLQEETIYQAGRGLAYSPDSSILASNSDGALSIWATQDWSLRNQLIDELPTSSSDDVAFTPDGKLIAMGMDDGSIHLWGVSLTTEYGLYLPFVIR